MNQVYLKAVVCRSVAMVSSLATGMLSLRLYSRYFDVDRYGLVLVAMQILAYLPLLDGGFRTVLNRRLLASGDAAEKARLIHFGQVLYSFLGGLVLVVSVGAMAAYAFLPNARLSGQPLTLFVGLGVAATLSFLNSTQAALLVGLRAQAQLFLLNAVGTWVNLGAFWVCLKAGVGLWAFVISMVTVVVVTWPVAVQWIRREAPGMPLYSFGLQGDFRAQFKQLRGEAWACGRSQVVTVVLYSVDILIVGLLGTPTQAAVYGTLTRMFTILRSFLQTSGEAAWPIIAEKGLDSAGFGTPLLRLNAWAFGGVLGAAAATLLPFCRWYMGDSWTATPALLALFVGRYLVTGLAMPASYCLFGLGRMELITRCLQRELVVGLVLGLGLWVPLGLNGVAAGFGVATFMGTFLPLFLAYGEATASAVGRILFGIWWRATTSFAVGFGVAWLAMHRLAPNWQTMAAGALGVVAGVGVAAGIAWIRSASAAGLEEAAGGRLRRALRMF